MIKDLLIKELTEIQDVVPSGSYYICGITNTDRDYFTKDTPEARQYLLSKGFKYDTGRSYECNATDYTSFRNGKVNVVLVYDLDKCELATQLAKALRLEHKSDRLRVFNTVRYGVCSNLPSYELDHD